VNVEDAAREGFTHRVFRRGIVCGQQGKGGGGEGGRGGEYGGE
jgi:hypothetical protein